MVFEKTLRLDAEAVTNALGVPRGDAHLHQEIMAAETALQQAAHPRWVWRPFRLDDGRCLAGDDIARHLAGCDACVLLALSLGDGVDRLIRTAETADMARAVLLDAMASVLAEQYAQLAEAELRQDCSGKGLYLTGRFSPGYGDLPLALQGDLLLLLDAQRAIGLTVSATGIMLPRKSITAILGVAGHPVAGHLAGCEHCEIREKCALRKEGKRCDRADKA